MMFSRTEQKILGLFVPQYSELKDLKKHAKIFAEKFT